MNQHSDNRARIETEKEAERARIEDERIIALIQSACIDLQFLIFISRFVANSNIYSVTSQFNALSVELANTKSGILHYWFKCQIMYHTCLLVIQNF